MPMDIANLLWAEVRSAQPHSYLSRNLFLKFLYALLFKRCFVSWAAWSYCAANVIRLSSFSSLLLIFVHWLWSFGWGGAALDNYCSWYRSFKTGIICFSAFYSSSIDHHLRWFSLIDLRLPFVGRIQPIIELQQAIDLFVHQIVFGTSVSVVRVTFVLFVFVPLFFFFFLNAVGPFSASRSLCL